MIQIYEEIEEEFEVPTEESDSNSKTIPCDIYHEQKNVLTLNKGRVKEEDFNYFGIETAPIQKNDITKIKMAYNAKFLMVHPKHKFCFPQLGNGVY